MGKIFYIMGKSASGKDKIYSRLAGNKGLNLKKLILYTTRPVRDGEENGKQYYFTDEKKLQEFKAEGKVTCPKWLEDDAKKEWRRLAKQMEQLGILTEVDMAAFAGYCQAYARWKEAEEFISRHGAIVKTPSGYWQQVPQVSIAQQYMKQMSKFCEQFGLTPASRSRIVTDRGNDSSDDAMEQLLSLGGEKK